MLIRGQVLGIAAVRGQSDEMRYEYASGTWKNGFVEGAGETGWSASWQMEAKEGKLVADGRWGYLAERMDYRLRDEEGGPYCYVVTERPGWKEEWNHRWPGNDGLMSKGLPGGARAYGEALDAEKRERER